MCMYVCRKAVLCKLYNPFKLLSVIYIQHNNNNNSYFTQLLYTWKQKKKDFLELLKFNVFSKHITQTSQLCSISKVRLVIKIKWVVITKWNIAHLLHGNIIIFSIITKRYNVHVPPWNDFRNSDRAEICFVKGDDTWVHHFTMQTKHMGIWVWALKQSFRGCWFHNSEEG